MRDDLVMGCLLKEVLLGLREPVVQTRRLIEGLEMAGSATSSAPAPASRPAPAASPRVARPRGRARVRRGGRHGGGEVDCWTTRTRVAATTAL